jgi:hypothetical protein
VSDAAFRGPYLIGVGKGEEARPHHALQRAERDRMTRCITLAAILHWMVSGIAASYGWA